MLFKVIEKVENRLNLSYTASGNDLRQLFSRNAENFERIEGNLQVSPHDIVVCILLQYFLLVQTTIGLVNLVHKVLKMYNSLHVANLLNQK
jgi:hypothetical protein